MITKTQVVEALPTLEVVADRPETWPCRQVELGLAQPFERVTELGDEIRLDHPTVRLAGFVCANCPLKSEHSVAAHKWANKYDPELVKEGPFPRVLGRRLIRRETTITRLIDRIPGSDQPQPEVPEKVMEKLTPDLSKIRYRRHTIVRSSPVSEQDLPETQKKTARHPLSLAQDDIDEDVVNRIATEAESLWNSRNELEKDRRPSGRVDFLEGLERVPLLSREGERELAKLIEKGKEALQDDGWSKDVNKLEDIVIGNWARERFISANIGLIVKIVKDFKHKGVLMEDMFNEGYIALASAVDRFNWRRGTAFSTFGYFEIWSCVDKFVDKARYTVNFSDDVVQLIESAAEITIEYQQTRSREPTNGELSDRLGVSSEKLAEILAARERMGLLSLDVPVQTRRRDGAMILADTVGIEEAGFEVLERRLGLESFLSDASRVLSSEELLILRLKFGIGEFESHTHQQIADVLGFGEAKSSRLFNQVMDKLRLEYSTPSYRNAA